MLELFFLLLIIIQAPSFILIKKKKKKCRKILFQMKRLQKISHFLRNIFSEKIGYGCFGKVFQVINLATRQISALKVETQKYEQSIDDQRYNIDIQYNILKRLRNIQGIPKVFQIGSWTKGKFLQLQLLQNDFSVLTHQSSEISKQQLQKIGTKFIKLFKQIHESGIIHRDLKPQNMMENHLGQLYIIDFGISKSYSVFSNSSKKRGFVGTPRYASIAAHQGKQQGPKDDLQSLFYVLAHFFFKFLPWMKLPQTPTRLQNIAKIKLERADAMFMKIGTNFFKCFRYIRQIGPQQKINYEALIQLLSNSKAKTMLVSHKIKKQEKKLSLPPNQFMDPNKLIGRDRKYSISTIRQVIQVTQATDKSVGTIVINWVNKEEFKDQKQLLKTSLMNIKQQEISQMQNLTCVTEKRNNRHTKSNEQKINCEARGSTKVSKSQGDSSCFNTVECDEDIQQNQPEIRIAQKFKTYTNPFFQHA